MSVALVTDSTAYLPAGPAARSGVAVVPLQAAFDGIAYGDEEVTPERLTQLLRTSSTMTTSRPAPAVLAEVYRRLARQGAEGIVSAHLSGRLSGTCEAALVASREVDVPVRVVDSGSIGMTLGHAVLAGVAAARDGGDLGVVHDVVERRARAGSLLFLVRTLDHLGRGGRIGRAAAFVGSALAVRPILALEPGGVVPVEKARTLARASTRLVDLCVERAEAGRAPVAVTVHHLAEEERAHRLAAHLADRLGERVVGDVDVLPIGAVGAVHLGPGAMAVSLSPDVGTPPSTAAGA